MTSTCATTRSDLGLEHADRTPAECEQIPRTAEGHGSDARADGPVHLAGLQILDDEPALLKDDRHTIAVAREGKADDTLRPGQ